jgi:oligoendopeptidase F
MKKRSEAEISTTWKLEDMVPDNETWEKQLKEASGELISWTFSLKIT